MGGYCYNLVLISDIPTNSNSLPAFILAFFMLIFWCIISGSVICLYIFNRGLRKDNPAIVNILSPTLRVDKTIIDPAESGKIFLIII